MLHSLHLRDERSSGEVQRENGKSVRLCTGKSGNGPPGVLHLHGLYSVPQESVSSEFSRLNNNIHFQPCSRSVRRKSKNNGCAKSLSKSAGNSDAQFREYLDRLLCLRKVDQRHTCGEANRGTWQRVPKRETCREGSAAVDSWTEQTSSLGATKGNCNRTEASGSVEEVDRLGEDKSSADRRIWTVGQKR